MTKSQRNAIITLIRFYRERNNYNGVTSVRIKDMQDCEYFISLIIETRRSDCEKYSPRATIAGQSANFHIGKRGGISVIRAESGLRDEIKHISKMLGAKIPSWAKK